MSGQPVQVTVTLTAEQYRALAAISERKQTNARHLIEGLVSSALRPAPTPPEPEQSTPAPAERSCIRVTAWHLERISEYAALGYSNQEIADRINISRSTVGVHRRRLGLDSLGRGRPTTIKENAA